MSKERINSMSRNGRKNRLRNEGKREGSPMAEIIRRALDAYLAWDDPTYAPVPKPQERNAHSFPAVFDGG